MDLSEWIQDASCLQVTNQVAEFGRRLYAGQATLEDWVKAVAIGDGVCAPLVRHSVATAFAARALCEQHRDPAGPVVASALLHDLGLVALAEAGRGVSSPAAHAAVGGELLRQRDFSAELVAAVAHHHRVAEAGQHERLAAYCFYGDMLAGFLGVLYPQTVFDPRSRARALDVLAVKSEEVPRHIQQAQAAFAAWRQR